MLYVILTLVFAILTIISSYASICVFTHRVVYYNVQPETITFAALSILNGYSAIKQSYKKLPIPSSKEEGATYLVAQNNNEDGIG